MDGIGKYLELVKKHGVNAVLLLWLFSVSRQVSILEQKVYDCYEARIIETRLSANRDTKIKDTVKQFAVLVREPKVETSKKKENA